MFRKHITTRPLRSTRATSMSNWRHLLGPSPGVRAPARLSPVHSRLLDALLPPLPCVRRCKVERYSQPRPGRGDCVVGRYAALCCPCSSHVEFGIPLMRLICISYHQTCIIYAEIASQPPHARRDIWPASLSYHARLRTLSPCPLQAPLAFSLGP